MEDSQFNTWRHLLELRTSRSWSAYRRILAEKNLNFGSDDLISGFFRKQPKKGAPWEPVGMWREHGDLFIEINGSLHGPVQGGDKILDVLFDWSVWDPITAEMYEERLETDKWPDVHEYAPPPQDLDGLEELVGRIGDNNPPRDEVEDFKIEVENAAEAVKSYAMITDDDMAKRAQTARSRLLEIHRKIEARRKLLLAPLKQAVEALNIVWKPLSEKPKAAADSILAAMTAWENKKLREQREAAAAAAAANKPIETKPATTSIRGGVGRAASVKTVEVVTEVADWDALWAYFREDIEVRALLTKKAQQQLTKFGEVVPGIKTETQKRVA
jgi:hypothetical protein